MFEKDKVDYVIYCRMGIERYRTGMKKRAEAAKAQFDWTAEINAPHVIREERRGR